MVVIGTGFGGSVAALRLAEKGYSVHMYEAGRRFEDEDFAETSWDVKNYVWAPNLGLYGVQRIHKLPDVMILAGAGVGGGSLNYANTLYVPPDAFFADQQWSHITDWKAELLPHYATAKAMLGVVEQNPCEGPIEQLMKDTADDLGVGDTFRKTPVGVFFGMPGVRVEDPYFGGTGCTECGNCMVGCRVGAKNTLRKNYLAFAEQRGVTIEPMRTVVEIRPVDPARDDSGWLVTTERTGPRHGVELRTVTAGQVVLAAGTWGTQKLLHAMKDSATLPRLSDRLGYVTRTNSEMLGGASTVTVPPGVDLTKGVAITTSFHVDNDTHVENVRYGRGSNLMAGMTSLLLDGDSRVPRFVQLVRDLAAHPVKNVRGVWGPHWSERTVIALVMQSLDNSITVSGTRTARGRVKLTSRQGHGEPNPTWIPQGQRAVRALARRLQQLTGVDTIPGGSMSEAANMPLTAHFLGGVVISDDGATGVIDPYHRVHGYPSLHVVDGSAVSANLGVNPALTITAQAERALSLWPAKGEADQRPSAGAAYRRLPTVPAAVPGQPALTS